MIRLVSATQKDKSNFDKTQLYHTYNALNKSGIIGQLDEQFIYFSNTKGLSQVYNDAINKAGSDDILILIHDDVLLTDALLDIKLEKYFKEYDILGLAGTKSWSLKSPAVWHNCDTNNYVGSVGHYYEQKYWMTNFGKSPNNAVILDGLFIAIIPNKLKSVRFDEQFTFHHYDMDFCLTAYSNNIKMGVIPIWVTHYSVGEWRNDEVWKDSEKYFLRKWSC